MIKKCKLIIAVIVITLIVLIIPANKAEASGFLGGVGYEGDYPVENYVLDYYGDFSFSDRLPWNISDNMAKSLFFSVYVVTGMVWTANVYMCDILGVVINEAYSFDIIGGLADEIGAALQGMAGVSPDGISMDGLYAKLLVFLIVILGIWSVYTGLIKHETSKVVSNLTSFILIFILSGAFIAYSPAVIKNVNEFSNDISNALLDVGGRYLLDNDDDNGNDYVQDIRDVLWDIQVHIPWLVLEFGESDEDVIGSDRIDAILNNPQYSEIRDDAIKAEAENGNMYMVMVGTQERCMRCGFFVLINLGISIFVFIMCVIMIFSQIMFILYVMFLPVSFLLAMIPGYTSYARKAIEKVFNSIMTRAGIMLIITCSFFLSSVVWRFSKSMAASSIIISQILQVIIFGGIYFILGDLMSMFRLSSDSRQMANRMLDRHVQHISRRSSYAVMYKLKKSALKAGFASTGVGAVAAAANTGAKAVKTAKASNNARQAVADTGKKDSNKTYGNSSPVSNITGNSSTDSAAFGRKNTIDSSNADAIQSKTRNKNSAPSGKNPVKNKSTSSAARTNDTKYNELMKEVDNASRPTYRRTELLAKNTLPVAERRTNIAKAQEEYHNSFNANENKNTATRSSGQALSRTSAVSTSDKSDSNKNIDVKKSSGKEKSRPLVNRRKTEPDAKNKRGGR